jgi:3-dehydroquinate synthase
VTGGVGAPGPEHGPHVPPAPGLADAAGGRLAYPVWLGDGALAHLGAVVAAAAPAHRIALVTDAAVAALHAGRALHALAPLAAAEPVVVAIPVGEAHKTRDTWAAVTDRLLAAGCGRDTTVVALGGGVVGDLAGFVAATYLRGVPVVQVPTTLLAMVDASVGGKTAVDVPAGKNLVGAFHPPAAVLLDPALLTTLPAPDLRAGAAEALKHGVIASERHFADVAALLPTLSGGAPAGGAVAAGATAGLASVVGDSVAIKAAVVAEDPREHGRRKTLNFGHTIGHAVESVGGYVLRHGEAVAVGMVAEGMLAERLGVAHAGTAARVRAACVAGRLPVTLPPGLDPASVLAATRSDKKARAGRVEYALPTHVGGMVEAGGRWAVPVDDALVLEVLTALAALAAAEPQDADRHEDRRTAEAAA